MKRAFAGAATISAAVAVLSIGGTGVAAAQVAPQALPHVRCVISGDPSGTYWQVQKRREAWIPIGKPMPGVAVDKGGSLDRSKTRKVTTSKNYTSENQIGFDLGADGLGVNMGNTKGVSWTKTISISRTTQTNWQNTFSVPAHLEFWSEGVAATVQEWEITTTQKGCGAKKVSPAQIRTIYSPLKKTGYTIAYGWTNTENPTAYVGSYNVTPHQFVKNPVKIS